MPRLIYLDNHATTPVDPRVLKAMQPYFRKAFGNAASNTHRLGREARKAVEAARARVARLLGCGGQEVVFTSGATEANNLAIKGVMRAYGDKGDHVITVATEHKSVLDVCKRLEMERKKVTRLPVRSDGSLDVGAVERAITSRTVLISVMAANNEIGVLQPVAAIGAMARRRKIIFHCDAAQAAGKVPLDVRRMQIDLLALSAHKLYGPKGAGALYIRKTEPRVKLWPLLDGGGHEGGFRSGTLNVPGIVGLGQACELARRALPGESKKIAALRDRLEEELLCRGIGCRVNGSRDKRLPNNLNVSFEGIEAGELIRRLPGLAISSGSACLSTSPEPSYVLKAIGLSETARRGSVRFGLGRFNTAGDIREAARQVVRAVRDLRRKRR